jgi:hypothetical protein
MAKRITTGPTFWTACALRLTTARLRLPAPMQNTKDQRIVKEALAQGWWLREASPRWDLIWQQSASSLMGLGVVILPGRGFGMDRFERSAMIMDRLGRAGLDVSRPDMGQLIVAEQIWRSRILPALADMNSHRYAKKGGWE